MAVEFYPHMNDFKEYFDFFAPRVGVAVLTGGIIGIERELKHKAAGLKTNIMICLGATLYTALSVLITTVATEKGQWGDPSRIAAQIVSGIGFLGGGAIIKGGANIIGLTTASTIWLVAALGICIGAGYYSVAILTALFVVVSLLVTNFFEDRVLGRLLYFSLELVVHDPEGEVRRQINDLLNQNVLVLEDFDLTQRSDNALLIHMRYSGHRADHKRFVLDLWKLSGIKEVRQLV
jgi:putative Mg2+ transporter-C (MgtC) family protein